LFELALQGVVILDSPLAFFRLLLANGLSSPVAGDKTSPTIVGAMKFGGMGFASTVGLAALAVGGGDRAGENGALGADEEGGCGGISGVFCA
jgi:hypothetical protein